jgi:CRP/FNR family transcriptional regulator, anaerobic regulatory protein
MLALQHDIATGHRLPPVMIRQPVGRATASATTAQSELDRLASTMRVGRGDVLCHEGDEATVCFRVVTGCIRLSKLLPDGRRHVMDFLFPGDFFGLVDDGEYEATAEALDAGSVVRYSRRQLEAAAERDIATCNLLRRAAGAGLAAAHARGMALARLGAAERLAVFLMWLAKRTGDGSVITLPMNRADIGDYLGLTIETVSRTIGQFKARGLIRLVDTRQIMLTNRRSLAAMAEGDLPLAA